MKVMYLPINTESIQQTGMYDAFMESGVDLLIFDFYRRTIRNESQQSIRKDFVEKNKIFKPDLLHMQLQFSSVIKGEDIKQVRDDNPNIFITNWTGDVVTQPSPEFIKNSECVDLALISSVGQLEDYRKKITCPVKYWQIGYNPKLYFDKNNTNFKYDISFIANYYPDSTYPDANIRTSAVAKLKKSYGDKFGLFGGGWPSGSRNVEQKNANDVYAESFACLSISNYNDLYCYYSDRLLMCLASGRPTICYRFPGCDALFKDNYNIIFVKSADEICGKLDWLKNNIEEANLIGKRGADCVRREHTYFSRVQELLRIVK